MSALNSTPMMPQTRAVPFSNYNPNTNIAAENQAKSNLDSFTTTQGNQAYKDLSPEQKTPFMPQWKPGMGPTQPGMGSIKITRADGTTVGESSDNTEGITKANFQADYRQRLQAGKGNVPLPGSGYLGNPAIGPTPMGPPLTGLAQQTREPQSEYEQLREKVNQATYARIHMIPQTGVPQVAPAGAAAAQDPYQVRVAQIRAQQGAAHDATAKDIATGKNDTTTTVAAGNNATATGIAEGKFRTDKEIATMKDDEKKSELQRTQEYLNKLLGIQQQKADQAGQPKPFDLQKAQKAAQEQIFAAAKGHVENYPQEQQARIRAANGLNAEGTGPLQATTQPARGGTGTGGGAMPTGTQGATSTQPAQVPQTQPGSPAATQAQAVGGAAGAPATRPATRGAIDKDNAKIYLQRAGGDIKKAQELAANEGWQVQ